MTNAHCTPEVRIDRTAARGRVAASDLTVGDVAFVSRRSGEFTLEVHEVLTGLRGNTDEVWLVYYSPDFAGQQSYRGRDFGVEHVGVAR